MYTIVAPKNLYKEKGGCQIYKLPKNQHFLALIRHFLALITRDFNLCSFFPQLFICDYNVCSFFLQLFFYNALFHGYVFVSKFKKRPNTSELSSSKIFIISCHPFSKVLWLGPKGQRPSGSLPYQKNIFFTCSVGPKVQSDLMAGNDRT